MDCCQADRVTVSTELEPEHKRDAGLSVLFLESSFLQVCDRSALIVSLLRLDVTQEETLMGHAYPPVYAGEQEEIIIDTSGVRERPQF